MEIFTLKKIASMLLMPLPLIVTLLLISWICIYRQRQKWAYSLQAIAVATLLLTSTSWLPNQLLGELEQQYHQFDLATPVKKIVVMGCGHTNDGRLPITSQLKPCSLYRLIEAMRIQQANPGSLLITSGYSEEPFSNAEEMRNLAISLGVAPERILMQTRSRDTEQEVINLKPMLSQQPFAMVTSASHMQRAMHLFEQQGLHPIAAPTEHFVKQSDAVEPGWWSELPHSTNIYKFERYWYEAMGQMWLFLRGK
ncbi:ElyC/SanA/YdcF family protein [Neptunicella sp. SCSIO 80796]|uniref:ElyC/SanA/YdcF family protein n=1 Tax=Neptunicella plasticusilytica TaxID=3117012 RepID=UPI003A4DAD61